MADHVIINPPYYDPTRFRASPDVRRADAHMLTDLGLEPWARTATDIVKEGGTITVIFRADGLRDLLDVFSGRFGAIDILPLHPREGTAATRIILHGVRGSKASLRLLPGFILHEGPESAFTPHAKAIMRDGAALPFTPRP